MNEMIFGEKDISELLKDLKWPKEGLGILRLNQSNAFKKKVSEADNTVKMVEYIFDKEEETVFQKSTSTD
jgi:hypothetical protein